MSYDPKSCNALEKPFYHPVEAAIRWCGLIENEVSSLSTLNTEWRIKPHHFPQWPCLMANTDRILEAIDNGELPYGRDGKTVSPSEHVTPSKRTVRHADLKAWMATYYPGQKPAFLFDEIERKTHTAINADSFRALQADLEATHAAYEAVKEEIDAANLWAVEVIQRLEALQTERDSLKDALEKAEKPPGERAERTYLNIIGGLLALLTEQTSPHKPAPFGNQTAVIDTLLERYPNVPGLSKRTLEDRFPLAKNSLSQKQHQE